MVYAGSKRSGVPPRGYIPPKPQAREEAEGVAQAPPFPYRARVGQAGLHEDPARFKVVVAHRRFGKTVFAVMQLVRAAVAAAPGSAARFAYVAPFYRQAKAIVWDYLKQYGRCIEGARFHETELRCDLPNGARISLYGADDPDSLRGLYFDGVVLDEYAQMDPRAWSEVIRPALADRGGWAIFIGTPMGRNSFWRLYEQAKTASDWRAALFRASDSGVLPAAELAAARAAMSEAEYAQEFECSFDAAIRGAYYGREIAAPRRRGASGGWRTTRGCRCIRPGTSAWATPRRSGSTSWRGARSG